MRTSAGGIGYLVVTLWLRAGSTFCCVIVASSCDSPGKAKPLHIARQSPQELVVVDGTRWVSAICAAVALFAVYRVISQHAAKGPTLVGIALLVFFALIADLRKTFTFDGMQRIMRWRGRTILKTESGEIPFDDITDIVIETSTTSSTRGTTSMTTYRLTINTARGTIPMAYNYRGAADGLSGLRRQILEFIRPGSQSASPPLGRAAAESLESSLRALLRQGRKIDAVALLRSTEDIGLTEAMHRIEAIECGIQQEE